MFMKDIRHTFRMLVKRPGFNFLLVFILAIGIAFTTTVFSLVSSVFLAPVPYKDPDRLVQVLRRDPNRGAERAPLSYPDMIDYFSESQSFEESAAYSFWYNLNLVENDGAEHLQAGYVTPSFFRVLNAKPFLGRIFDDSEDQLPSGRPVTILTYGLWQKRFGSNPDVIGKKINLSGQPYTIVGVLSRNFKTISANPNPEIFVPLSRSAIHLRSAFIEKRGHRWLMTVARLNSGVTLDQAQAEMLSLSHELQNMYPQTNADNEAQLVSFDSVRSDNGSLTEALTILAVGAALVFLLGCINVVMLLLARFVEREHEIAMRMALGAGRGPLVRQILTESVLLALIAGIIGFFLAFFGIETLFVTTPLPVPEFIEVDVRLQTFLVALLLAFLASLVSGMAPALKSARMSFNDVLRPGGKSVGSNPGRNFLRRVMVVTQIALSVVVLIGAGLMIRSFYVFANTGFGFDTRHLLTMRFELDGPRYAEDDAKRSFYRALEERISALPGVKLAGLWGPDLPGANWYFRDAVPEGRIIQSAEDRVRVFPHRASPGALKNLGIPLIAGRPLERTDHADATPVMVISESAAKALWPGEEALGKRVNLGTPGEDPWFTVVGIVGDAKHRGRSTEFFTPEDVYVPIEQWPHKGLGLFVRTEVANAAMTQRIREEVRALDSSLPVFDIATMEQRMGEEENKMRFNTLLMVLFAATAAILTVMGIYGLMSYKASQRTREIGIRMAMGAQKKAILWLMLNQTIVDMVAGIMAGLIGSFALTKTMSSMLFGVTTTDPITFVMLAGALIVVALLATFVPTRRALSVDPVTALRHE
jgi:predicted permease